MAVHQKMAQRIAGVRRQPDAEFQQLLDMAALRQDQPRPRIENVVEAQRQPLVRAVGGEIRRLRIGRIEDRQDMRRVLKIAELLQPADRETADGAFGRKCFWHTTPYPRMYGERKTWRRRTALMT